MSNEPLDPRLQQLFEDARQELDGEAITRQVMSRTHRKIVVAATSLLAAAAVALIGSWLFLSISLLDFALLASALLTNPLLELGEGWVALALMPVNSLAGLSLLGLKAAHSLRKLMLGASFTR